MTKPSSAVQQPAIRPVKMNLFPTMETLQSVVDLGLSQLPINNPNVLVSLLMTYHNSLLAQISATQEN